MCTNALNFTYFKSYIQRPSIFLLVTRQLNPSMWRLLKYKRFLVPQKWPPVANLTLNYMCMYPRIKDTPEIRTKGLIPNSASKGVPLYMLNFPLLLVYSQSISVPDLEGQTIYHDVIGLLFFIFQLINILTHYYTNSYMYM